MRESNAALAQPNILYIAYWGALEPLGRAVFLSTVRALAQRGARVTMLSFEKPADATWEAQREVRKELSRLGVRWIAARYHHKPQAPATLLDIAQGVTRILSQPGWRRFDVVQGRTLVGGAIGSLVAPLLGAKLVFSNEGYWADERVDAGTWTPDLASYKVAKNIEDRLFSRADAIMCMSEASRGEIETRPEVAGRAAPVMVVPACVDLGFFQRRTPTKLARAAEELQLLYTGTIGGGGATGPGVAHRYRLDWVAAFVKEALQSGHKAKLTVLTRAPQEQVRLIMESVGLREEAWTSRSATRVEVRSALENSSAGLHLMAPGRAAHAGSPIKIGEYWAMGLPVIVTPGIGDTGAICMREKVGVIVPEPTAACYRAALQQLAELRQDPELEARCRLAAQRYYNLEANVDRQMELYRALMHR